jgi:hypothetical protein
MLGIICKSGKVIISEEKQMRPLTCLLRSKEALHQTKEHVLMEYFSSCIKDIVSVK